MRDMTDIHVDLQRPRIDLNLLTTLDALFRHGTATAAAEELGVTQSAVSHALRKLRDHFGDPLCVRTGGVLQWTSRAVALRPVVSRILAEIEGELLAPEKFHCATTTRTFTLCLSEIAEFLFLDEFMRTFREMAPKARLRVLPGGRKEIPDMLEGGYVDVALGGMLPAMPPSLRQQRMIEYGWVVIAARAHPFSGKSVSRNEYLDRPHIVISRSGDFVDFIEPMLRRLRARRNAVLSLSNHLSGARVVATSNAIATVPDFVGSSLAALFAIETYPTALKLPRVTSRMYWHERFHRDPANQWLRQIVAKHFSPGS